MSFSDLGLPDYRDELEAEPVNFPTASKALLTSMLDQVDTKAIGAALKRDVPHVVLIKTPSASWAKAMARLVSETHSNAIAKAVTERKKGGDSLTEELQRRLTARSHVVLVSQDPDTLLPPSVAGAIDVRLDLLQPDKRIVAAAIGQVSGTLPPSLKASDIAGLDFDDLELALRDGSNASDCVRRLRRAAASVDRNKVTPGPRLEELPLGHYVRLWSEDMLFQLAEVSSGALNPSELSYPVLEGPPGTGKTLLASALARSAGWSFVSTSVGDWFATSDGHLGGVVRAATSFIDSVLATPETIGLIDELDALPDRATLNAKDRDWWTPVITQILLQIDRVRQANRPVILIGATNYHDRLDSALVRAGRLEQRVSVLPPSTLIEIQNVFEHYLGTDLDSGTLALAARLASGATPAQIAGWCRTVRTIARAAGRAIEPVDLINTVAPDSGRSDIETMAVAIHEAGHVALARHFGVKVLGVSILEKGRSGGHTLTETLSSFPNRFELEIMALILLGGRAADTVLGKGGHTGAENDLDRAGRLISDGIATYGLYGDIAPKRHQDHDLHARTNRILQDLMRVAVGVVRRDRHAILGLAQCLMAQRVMTSEAVDAAWEEPPDGVLMLPSTCRSYS